MDGMLHQGFKRVYSISILVFILTLLLVSTLPAPQASFIKNAEIVNGHASAIVAGRFFDVQIATTSTANKITVIMYRGDSIPDEHNRTVYNYYRWDYDHGVWKDNSGYEKSYIVEKRCKHQGNLYSFHVFIDPKAKTGRWKIKISIDNNESKSFSVNVKPFLPILGITSTSISKRRPFINLLKRSQSFRQKNIKKLLSTLSKENTIQALYISKEDTDEVTIPVLLDSPSSIEKIEKILIKKARKIFPNSRIAVIPLHDLPIEKTYNLIFTHRLFYARDENVVKDFEHDIVASYLDKTPPIATDELKDFRISINVVEREKSEDMSNEVSIPLVDEKPKIVEISRCHSTRKGVIPPPKLAEGTS